MQRSLCHSSLKLCSKSRTISICVPHSSAFQNRCIKRKLRFAFTRKPGWNSWTYRLVNIVQFVRCTSSVWLKCCVLYDVVQTIPRRYWYFLSKDYRVRDNHQIMSRLAIPPLVTIHVLISCEFQCLEEFRIGTTLWCALRCVVGDPNHKTRAKVSAIYGLIVYDVQLVLMKLGQQSIL